MSISFKALGAGQEVGRSCILIRIKDMKIMFDCGVHMAYNDHRKFPDFKKILEMGRFENKENSNSHRDKSSKNDKSSKKDKYEKNKSNQKSGDDDKFSVMYANVSNSEIIDYTNNLDLVIITHFHLDHVGALPYFTEICGYNGPILTSQPTKAILPLTLEDFRKVISDYKGEKSPLSSAQITNCVSKIQTIEIGETKVIKNRIKVTPYYAGHVLGAGMYHIDVDGYTVVYTGDYNTLTDRHLSGAYIPKIYPDLFITETTYGDTVRDTKRVREREFLKKIQSVVEKGGKVLIPIFALGRAQELCILLDTHWRRTNCTIPIYFAGPMAEKANFYYKTFTNWTNNAVKNIFLTHNVFDFSFVKHGDKSVIKSNTPMVIFATPGMLHGGLSLQIFKEIAPDPNNCVIIPGYCTAGTVGNKILNGERVIEIDKQNIEVKCDVYYMSFSAHADAKGILSLVKNASPKNLVLVHGDCEVMKKFQKTVESGLNIRTYMPPNLEEIPFERIEFYYKIDITKSLYDYLSFLIKTTKKNLINSNIKQLSDYKNNKNNNLKNSSSNLINVEQEENKIGNNQTKISGLISFDKIEKSENKSELNVFVNFGYNPNRKNILLSVRNPLKKFNLNVGRIKNKICLSFKNKNLENNLDVKNLFENYIVEKNKNIFQLYKFHLEYSNLEISIIENKIVLRWENFITEEKMTIYELIKSLEMFINISNN